MKKYLLLIYVLLTGLSAKEISGLHSPESVYVHRGEIYVSNLGKVADPLTKDEDGSIVKINPDGEIIPFIQKGLNAPKGMSVINNILYVTDIDTIKGFDLKTQKKVFDLSIPNSVFLNDLVSQKDKLYVSDTGSGNIYLIDPQNSTYKILAKVDMLTYGGGPNGLLVDKNFLYIVTYDPNQKLKGMLLKYSLKTHKFQKVSQVSGFLDGIAKDEKGNLLISSWGENLNGFVYKISQNNKIDILPIRHIKGCADIFYINKKLYIPAMLENKLIIYP